MRSAALGFVLLAAASVSSAQTSNVDIQISQGRSKASVEAARTEPYSGGPWAAVPAQPNRQGATPTASAFRVRAWKERDATRVVVYVVSRSATPRDRERETQLTTFVLMPGQTREVGETDQYGAAHVMVSAEPRR